MSQLGEPEAALPEVLFAGTEACRPADIGAHTQACNIRGQHAAARPASQQLSCGACQHAHTCVDRWSNREFMSLRWALSCSERPLTSWLTLVTCLESSWT